MLKELCEIYGVNEEQARALDINMNVALRAGAGSGKTRVLTKRFVRCLLENPMLTLDNIAAITFTKKAAVEMKDRIRKELSERISNVNVASEKKRISDLKMQITNSNIDTIHGFCGKVLREHFAFLGLDPNFSIMEEVDKSILVSEIADSVIRSFIEDEKNEATVRFLAENFSVGFFFGKFKHGILSGYDAMREKGMDVRSFSCKTEAIDINNEDPTKTLESVALILIDKLHGEDWENVDVYIADFYEYEMGTHAWFVKQDGSIANFPASFEEDENGDIKVIGLKGYTLPNKDEIIPFAKHLFEKDITDAIVHFRCNTE
jgi:ATP-dependent helicase/nuclease subunit A